MADHQHHTHVKTSNERALWLALLLTGGFMLAEIIGSFLTGSLALLSDAAHMLTDTIALIIALSAIQIAKRAADLKRTFGYHRFEILAAAFNALMLFVIAVYILYEAYDRLSSPPVIESTGMLIVASIGLAVNLISMRLLAPGKEKSLNIKSSYLEVWSDMLSSIGVILGALLIKWTEWEWIDSVIAVGIGLWVLPRTWILLKESIHILLEGAPSNISLTTLDSAIRQVKGVLDIHELHVWSITSGKVSLTAHLVLDPKYETTSVLGSIQTLLISEFGISHTTLQTENSRCLPEKDTCNL